MNPSDSDEDSYTERSALVPSENPVVPSYRPSHDLIPPSGSPSKRVQMNWLLAPNHFVLFELTGLISCTALTLNVRSAGPVWGEREDRRRCTRRRLGPGGRRGRGRADAEVWSQACDHVVHPSDSLHGGGGRHHQVRQFLLREERPAAVGLRFSHQNQDGSALS